MASEAFFPSSKTTSLSLYVFMKILFLVCFTASISLVSWLFFSTKTTHNYTRYSGPENQTLVGSFKDDEKLDISHILFGIGGSTKTWHNRRRYNELWWKPNITHGFVWLEKEPEGNVAWPENSPPYKVSEDTSRFKYTCWGGSRSSLRIARIVKESFELGLENVRWFVMGDDDTVFFTDNLVAVLGKYDHNQMYYVGGISESVEQAQVHSYSTAYGGGGFAVSYRLAAELARVLDVCIERYANYYGSDERVAACTTEIGVPITKELGFHQLDIHGNPYGLLAAHPVAPLVSLHHLDDVQPLFPGKNRIDSVKKLVKAYESDPSRTLQQSFCYDLNRNRTVSISWGYAIELYPFLVAANALPIPFETFVSWTTSSQGAFTFNTKVLSKDPCERPVMYFFDSITTKLDKSGGTGGTVTSYRRPPQPEGQCGNDNYHHALSIQMYSVSAPILDPNIWKKAPRRQCCEVIDGEDTDSVVRMKIRGCHQGESLRYAP